MSLLNNRGRTLQRLDVTGAARIPIDINLLMNMATPRRSQSPIRAPRSRSPSRSPSPVRPARSPNATPQMWAINFRDYDRNLNRPVEVTEIAEVPAIRPQREAPVKRRMKSSNRRGYIRKSPKTIRRRKAGPKRKTVRRRKAGPKRKTVRRRKY